MALNAGANVLLYCNNPKSPRIAVNAIAKGLSEGTVSQDDIQNNYKLIVELKKKRLTQPVEPFSIDKVKSLLGHADHKKFVADVVSGNVEEHLQKSST